MSNDRAKIIKANVDMLLNELPDTVELEAVCKNRSIEEILGAIDSGVKIIGENYVQEAQEAFRVIGNRAKWHFIGHGQKNKLKKIVRIFDMVETVDSFGIVEELDRICDREDKIMPVLIEVNIGREQQKFGVMPEDIDTFVRKVSNLSNIKIMGLMTMGPIVGEQEDARVYFAETKKIFNRIKKEGISNIEMKYLSMGMSNSYKVAIEEGANIVRIGRGIYGL